MSLCCKTKINTPAHVRSAGQRYDEIWNYVPFVCGKTWLYFKKWSGGSYSMWSSQAENRLSMADYFYVSMILFPLPVSSMPCNRSPWPSQAYMFSVPLPCVHTWHNRFCLVFSKKFNILSALSAHQPPTLPQIIDSREGWFWGKIGLACACGKMNFYLKETPFTPFFGLFVVKWSAFCR